MGGASIASGALNDPPFVPLEQCTLALSEEQSCEQIEVNDGPHKLADVETVFELLSSSHLELNLTSSSHKSVEARHETPVNEQLPR